MTIDEAKGNLIHAIRWNDMPSKEAFDMSIKALEQTRWISVNERLPEEGLAVLTYRENGDYEVNWLDFDGKWFWEDVVAWMLLPYKPQESEK